MEISQNMREEYAVFKEASGSDLEALTAKGWHLLCCLTHKVNTQACFSYSHPAGNAGMYSNGNASIPMAEHRTAYLLGRPRSDVLIETSTALEELKQAHKALSDENKKQEATVDDFARVNLALNERLDDLMKWTNARRAEDSQMERDIRRARERVGEELWGELTQDPEA